MKRTRQFFDNIKSTVEYSLNGSGRSHLDINDKRPFNPHNPELGYCFKYETLDTLIYKICVTPLGGKAEFTDYRILMHEIGHIYLRHLDQHQEFDDLILDAIRDHRDELIEYVNKSCGIDWADKLLDALVNDKYLNHSIHNIAMDMEVNSKVLSTEDVEEMESDIDKFLPETVEVTMLKALKDQLAEDDPNRKEIEDLIDKTKKETKIKLILPERYHFSDGTPFPSGKSYIEYLELIMANLDQFVKMIASIKKGGNGDTGDVTQEDIDGISNSFSNDPGGDPGGSSGNPIDDMKDVLGKNGKDNQSSKDDNPDTDHGSGDRDEGDKTRKDRSQGRGSGHGCGTTTYTPMDEIDMALNEIVRDVHHRVVKVNYKRDPLYLYNRGINRSVIAPVMRNKYYYDTNPRIVFLIDVSGSMPSSLIQRFITTINKHLSKINGGLKYDLIEWDTDLCSHKKDLNPKKSIDRIHCGGGTSIARGIEYFHKNYDPSAILVIASDFEDNLRQWAEAEKDMGAYTIYGLNYGCYDYSDGVEFKNIKVRKIPYRR